MRGAGVRARAVGVIVVVAALLGLLVYVIVRPGPARMTITARFATAPGLYKGNLVRILGMPVGHITSIQPGPRYATVRMSINRSDRVPAGAQALILAPDVVNDRYVELTPAYDGGRTMADGAVIPTSRTGVPISVDQIIASVDQLAKALGPKGANANGSLSYLLANAARVLGTNGPAVHQTLDSLGRAFGALSSQGPNLTSLLDNLGNLTAVASHYTGTYQAFATNLATVSTYLSGDDADLGATLSSLQQALGQLATFIQDNGSALGRSVANLKTFATAVSTKQAALGQVFSTLPVAMRNLAAAFNPDAPGGPALKARFDAVSGSKTFSSSVCGSSLLRLLLLVPAVAPVKDPDPTMDLDCGVNGVLSSLPTPPGAGTGPNLSLSAMFGSGS